MSLILMKNKLTYVNNASIPFKVLPSWFYRRWPRTLPNIKAI